MAVRGEAQFQSYARARPGHVLTWVGYSSKSVTGDGIVEDHRLEFAVEGDGVAFFNADRQEVSHATLVKQV